MSEIAARSCRRAGLAARCAAQAGPGPSFAIVLVFVYGFILFTFVLSFTDSQDPAAFGWLGWRQLRAAVRASRAWGIAVKQPAIFGSLYIVICCAARAAARDPPRPEDPRRGRSPHDLPLSDGAVLHRHRHGVEVVPRSRHRPAGGGARPGAGRASPSTGSRTRTWRSTRSSSPRSGSPRAS